MVQCIVNSKARVGYERISTFTRKGLGVEHENRG